MLEDASNAEAEQHINALTTNIREAFKQAEAMLSAIKVVEGTTQGRVGKNARRQLAIRLQGKLSQFRKMQKSYLERLEQKGSEQKGGGGGAGGGGFMDEAGGDDGGGGSAGDALASIDMMLDETSLLEEVAREREVEILKIVKEIQEVRRYSRQGDTGGQGVAEQGRASPSKAERGTLAAVWRAAAAPECLSAARFLCRSVPALAFLAARSPVSGRVLVVALLPTADYHLPLTTVVVGRSVRCSRTWASSWTSKGR
jgi:hypothetical protein